MSHSARVGTESVGSTPAPDRGTEDAGLHKSLKNRQIQMIGLGGAIGTGLFMGVGGRLANAGPGVALIYALCGVFVFLLLRALGELVLYRPASGSFVSYTREFFGERLAYFVGWMYWVGIVTAAIADLTAVALYFDFFSRYIPAIGDVPQWVFALAALVFIVALNLLAVNVFGELEFWFALIKVAALAVFLVVGIVFVVTGMPVAGHRPGLSVIADSGGLFPNGLVPALLLISGVVFAYTGVEYIGTAAGEAQEPERVIPKAVNAVIFRIGVLYVGSILLLACMLPYSAYKSGQSPFVTFFGAVGVQGIDTIMNLIVLTAALSGINAGVYTSGRVMRSLAIGGSAPAFAVRLSAQGVPYGGIAMEAGLCLVGVALNAFVPHDAFEIALGVSSACFMAPWAAIILCQLQLWRRAQRGELERPSFRMMGAPWTGYACLAFFALVIVLIALEFPAGTASIGASLVLVLALAIGWVLRGRKGRDEGALR